ncbi:MAG: HNH endonuclease [Gammaproteobacteria bacterium]|nr:HNH endonuclease [Gammaproteobacteria bacterium]
MTPERFLRLVNDITIWKKGSQRAPHKPLLLLLMLGRSFHGEARLIPFTEAETRFGELWRRFGPPRRGLVQYPFRYLENDGIWEIPRVSELPSWDTDYLRLTDLRKHDVEGGFTREVSELLESDPELALRAARLLLAGHFPISLHDEIFEAVGLSHDLWVPGLPRLREPGKKQRMVGYRRPRRLVFRKEVLEAYDERCAICDFDLRINDELLGLEAAHIQWHSHNGPDNVFNGLALCLLHHRALDRGAVGLEAKGKGYRVLVSGHVRGSKPSESLLSDSSGQLIRPPQSRLHVPHRTFVDWHRAQVFRN